MSTVSIINLALTTLIFVLSFQYQAPRWSKSGVVFATKNRLAKLTFGLLMTAGWLAITSGLGNVIVAAAYPAVSGLLASAQGLGMGAGILLLAIMGGTAVASILLMNWLLTMLAGCIMPQVIIVKSPAAAFKAALAPTLWLSLSNGLMALLPFTN